MHPHYLSTYSNSCTGYYRRVNSWEQFVSSGDVLVDSLTGDVTLSPSPITNSVEAASELFPDSHAHPFEISLAGGPSSFSISVILYTYDANGAQIPIGVASHSDSFGWTVTSYYPD